MVLAMSRILVLYVNCLVFFCVFYSCSLMRMRNVYFSVTHDIFSCQGGSCTFCCEIILFCTGVFHESHKISVELSLFDYVTGQCKRHHPFVYWDFSNVKDYLRGVLFVAFVLKSRDTSLLCCVMRSIVTTDIFC